MGRTSGEDGFVFPFRPVPTFEELAFDPQELNTADLQALRDIVTVTARTTGEEFFETLVIHLARLMEVEFAFICEFANSKTRVRTLSFFERGKLLPNFEFDLAGTPCEDVLNGNLCHYPKGIEHLFPDDIGMIEMGIDSYLGVPLVNGDGEILGHLAVCHDRPMPPQPRQLFIFHIVAARAAAELERLRVEEILSESERRYRDLYNHAPVGNLSTGVDGRFLHVSDRAAEWLGYNVDELVGAELKSVLADTPEGLARGLECFQRFLAGQEVCDVELELKAKNGRSVWVLLYVRPLRDECGHVVASRSVWVNITDRVEAQRERLKLQRQNQYLQDELKSVHNFDEIVGGSPALRVVLDSIRRVAVTDSTVLIAGETGTGKELVARAVHSLSRRRDKPLIKLNCAALPSGLIESELFGHEKGAFTGALARKQGRFELADGGTIFLDEIGELPLEAQAKLLRVLQEQEFERIGGVCSIKVNVRVIAATNRNLQQCVADKTFREDLYFRLNVFPVSLPPLRERMDDLPLLVDHLIKKYGAKIGRKFDAVDPQSLQRLCSYVWPGNIRELENIIERAAILSNDHVLYVGDDVLPMPGVHVPHTITTAASGQADIKSIERDHILQVLDQSGWVIEGERGAARVLGLHPNTLRSRMKKLGIERTKSPS